MSNEQTPLELMQQIFRSVPRHSIVNRGLDTVLKNGEQVTEAYIQILYPDAGDRTFRAPSMREVMRQAAETLGGVDE